MANLLWLSLQRLTKKIIIASCASFVILSTALWSDTARAQAGEGCGNDVLTRASLDSIGTATDEQRISVARSLIENWQVSLPTMMAAIETMKNTDASTWGAFDRQQMTFIVSIIKAILASKNRSIALFRQCDNERTIIPLVWAARGNETDLRLNAASILADTVDNTNVCFVLHHLRDRDISANGRANLVGIARAMASYAYKENVQAIMETIDIVQANMGVGEGFAQTKQLLYDLGARATRSSNRNEPLPEALAKYCKSYNYNSVLKRTDL